VSLAEQIDTLARRNGKSAAAFRTISEVATDLDVPPHVLRFWESKFPQIKPLKRGGGRRYYRPEDIELLRRIRTLLYRDGYTIKGVQKLLKTPGSKSAMDGEIEGEDTLILDGVEAAPVATHTAPASAKPKAPKAPLPSAPPQQGLPTAHREPSRPASPRMSSVDRGDLFASALQRPLDAEARAIVADVIAELEALRATLLPRED
jgi:DNA-binding transcriptional MerR regulator